MGHRGHIASYNPRRSGVVQNSSHMRCADTAMACSPLNWNFLFVWPVARNRRQVPAPPPPPRSQASQAARGPLRLRSTPRAPSAPSASTSFSASHLPAPARRATRPAPRRQHLPPHPRAVRPSPPAGHTPRAPSAPGAPTLFSATHAQVPVPVLLAAAYPLNPFKCISAWSCTYSQDRL
jgi:hypothetical protein